MFSNKRITGVYNTAERIPFGDLSKIVIFSDCHRNNGSHADNFAKNQNLFFAALKHYDKQGFTYVEAGDGDELWENKSKYLPDIVEEYSHVFWLMSKFYKEGRLYMLYGNHDAAKRKEKVVRAGFDCYYDTIEKRCVPLFPEIKLHEGLVFVHKVTGNKIFILHGHQADFFNDSMWRLSRFLVRYLWSPVEGIGIKNPTDTSRSNKKKVKIENKLMSWATDNNQMIIAGHTHRTVFPEVGEAPYFNDGCCVHPRCITAIEIENGYISLVKWSRKVRNDGTLYIGHDVLAGPENLDNYFDSVTRVQALTT